MTGLTFIGLTALEDPPKLKVKEAVETCKKAGIQVIMITGDQPLTATAIARQVSIIKSSKTVNEIAEEKGSHFLKFLDESDAVVVHGEELNKFVEEDKTLPLEDQRLAIILKKKEVVFARTSPAQKYIIVDYCQKIGHIVAVTGDGVNDSPAIKKADIGIAMGIVGSDVAKDAADMLLMDDNFASIVDGVEEGRKIFDNLGKSIAYALTPNIPELIPVLALIVFQIPIPLSPVLMLVVCLGTDMWPSISLSFEYPELDIMNRHPRNASTDHLVTSNLISVSYVQMGCYETMAGFLAYFTVMYDYGFAPSTLWFFALSVDGAQPGPNDVYNPENEYKGNTMVGTDNDGQQVNWGFLNDAQYDLRVWFYKINDWPSCRYPEDISRLSGYPVCYNVEALAYAQTSYFFAMIVGQWANVICVKTKRGSILHHGLRNKVTVEGLAFETCLALMIGFVPGLDFALGSRRLHFLHYFVPGLPFFIYIVLIEEIRKYVIRYQRNKNMSEKTGRIGWFERNTLY